MKVGYIRTPKKDQNPDLQRRDLEAFGCERFFEEWTSSRKVDQPELRAAMDFWREGDEFVVWKLDRFGRIVYHVFGAMAELERDLILERMMAGLEARARGCKGGRKPVMEERKIALASKLMRDRDTPISKVCDVVGVSRATLYRYLEPDGKLRRRNGTEP